MGCELALHITGCAEGGLIQRVEILLNGKGAASTAMQPASRSSLEAANCLLASALILPASKALRWLLTRSSSTNRTTVIPKKKFTQQFTLAEPIRSILRKGGVVRNTVGQVEATEPAIRETKMHFFAETPLRPSNEATVYQQHADQ